MTSVTYTTIVAGVGNLEENTHVIDRACEMARLCDATLLLVAGFDPVSARDKARVADTAQVADVRVNEVQLTEDEAYAVVEKARDIAVERGVGLAQGVVVEGTAVSAVTLVTLEAEADLVVVGSRGVDSLLGRLFGAVSIQVLRKSRCDVLVVVEPDAASDSAAALRAAANSVAAAAVEAVIREAAGDLLEEVRLFDVFRGPQLGEGRKSLAFSLRLRATDRTLTAEELAGVRRRVVKRAAKRLGAELRA